MPPRLGGHSDEVRRTSRAPAQIALRIHDETLLNGARGGIVGEGVALGMILSRVAALDRLQQRPQRRRYLDYAAPSLFVVRGDLSSGEVDLRHCNGSICELDCQPARNLEVQRRPQSKARCKPECTKHG